MQDTSPMMHANLSSALLELATSLGLKIDP